MNKSNLKRYAPLARLDFIAAVTARAHLLGLSEGSGSGKQSVQAEPCTVSGSVAMIAGRAWAAGVRQQREALIARMQHEGFTATLEAIAYTWFNRLAALRYMELHDYLGHGRRILSNPSDASGKGLPEVLAHALELAEAGDLPGLNADKVRELKLANQDGELFRRILVAQCNALSKAMPFLFEEIDDETELLLPDNLLLSDSISTKLVAEIPDEDWAEVEVIGWLYQFYISEKKDQVIGKVVKSEDIPAATQLFTPNWIVQYLVQNSVGRLWLMANPSSTLASEWPYYIQPAEQTPEVQAQLDALIQTRVREDGGEALNPESITVLDPACGSGHILVVAYDVLKAIYLERGYQPRAIPRLILEKNLFGLDIDDRAAQMAAFALLMKARADDRRLFSEPLHLNIHALQDSAGLDDRAVAETIFDAAIHLEGGDALHSGQLFGGTQLATEHSSGMRVGDLRELIQLFAHGKTFGSLLMVPDKLVAKLVKLASLLQAVVEKGDALARAYAEQVLEDYLLVALVLAKQFDAAVANPPYMGNNSMEEELKAFGRSHFSSSRSDLFSMMMDRAFSATKSNGYVAMVTMHSWMFLSSYEELRTSILLNKTITSMAHLGARAFPEISGEVVQATAFILRNTRVHHYIPIFQQATNVDGDKKELSIREGKNVYDQVPQELFLAVPGKPLSYWASPKLRLTFAVNPPLSNFAEPRKGMVTADNPRFIRAWSEISFLKIGLGKNSRILAKTSGAKWFPYHKGGEFRKWYGNHDWVINWGNDGEELLSMKGNGYKVGSTNHNLDYIFDSAILWTKITSNAESFRYSEPGFLFDDASGICPVIDKKNEFSILALLNSKIVGASLGALNQTLNLNPGDLACVPCVILDHAGLLAKSAYDEAQKDWDLTERSWDFSGLYWTKGPISKISIEKSWASWRDENSIRVANMIGIETKINEVVIRAYGLETEISPEVLESQITLARADREKDSQRLISYAIGCMMGRYSLDEPGLIYAHAGNVGFDPSRYENKFPADADGIIPITHELWFADDGCSRIREFLRAVWGPDTLDENMAWLAESLGVKTGETPEEAIRRYVAGKFYKDHLQTYKKRPIYWLFSSGKQGAFQALVYLHRYHEGTLARLRSEYVLPLTGKLQTRLDRLEADIAAATSTAERTKLSKQRENLRKQQLELLAYEEKLRHYADQRIALDLDDGVKVNYGKFGDLLAEVKAVTGGTSDD